MFQFSVWPMRCESRREAERALADIAANQKSEACETIIARCVEPKGCSLGGAPSTSHPETGVVQRSTGDKTCLKPNTKANNER
jgi:hypothetical protein